MAAGKPTGNYSGTFGEHKSVTDSHISVNTKSHPESPVKTLTSHHWEHFPKTKRIALKRESIESCLENKANSYILSAAMEHNCHDSTLRAAAKVSKTLALGRQGP